MKSDFAMSRKNEMLLDKREWDLANEREDGQHSCEEGMKGQRKDDKHFR